MKTFEIHVSAKYTTDGGSEHWNAFKEYVAARNATEAKKSLRSELKADGYKSITLDAIEV